MTQVLSSAANYLASLWQSEPSTDHVVFKKNDTFSLSIAQLGLPFTHKSILRLETLLSAIFYQPERLELQQPSGNALGKSKDNIAV
ncbi:MAG: hypothetical protein K940chlam7_01569 [Chlamydiae bacterium]|nr:hypothetical protein [Chlamydiota bacterium]